MGSAIVGLFNGEQDVAEYGDTGLFEPVLEKVENPENETEEVGKAEVHYTNTYTGGDFHPLSVEKQWTEWTASGQGPFAGQDMSNLRPETISVKLYRQWEIGDGQYAWEQVQGPDDRDVNSDVEKTGWTQMEHGVLKLQSNNGKWGLVNPLLGLWRVAPNGELYEYFVVEVGYTTPDPDNGNAYYAQTSTTPTRT